MTHAMVMATCSVVGGPMNQLGPPRWNMVRKICCKAMGSLVGFAVTVSMAVFTNRWIVAWVGRLK